MTTAEQITCIIKACAKSVGTPANEVQFSKSKPNLTARRIAMYMCYNEGIDEHIILSAFKLQCLTSVRIAIRKIHVAITTQATPEQDQIATWLADADLEYNLICESYKQA